MDISKSLSSVDDKFYLTKPPFYTIQPHAETRERQLKIWGNILIEYFQANKVTECTSAELASDSNKIFVNQTIKRRLPIEGIKLVLENLAKINMIDWKTPAKESFFVYYYNPHEIADLIMKWSATNIKKGKLETLQWISSGEETDEKDKLHGMPLEILFKACKVLEGTGKVQIYELEGREYAVKFL